MVNEVSVKVDSGSEVMRSEKKLVILKEESVDGQWANMPNKSDNREK